MPLSLCHYAVGVTLLFYCARFASVTLDPLNPKSIDLDSAEDYYCAKFQVIPIRGFHFIILIYISNSHIVRKIKWSQYPCHRTTSSVQIISTCIPIAMFCSFCEVVISWHWQILRHQSSSCIQLSPPPRVFSMSELVKCWERSFFWKQMVKVAWEINFPPCTVHFRKSVTVKSGFMFEITLDSVSDYRQIQMSDHVFLSANSKVCTGRDGEGNEQLSPQNQKPNSAYVQSPTCLCLEKCLRDIVSEAHPLLCIFGPGHYCSEYIPFSKFENSISRVVSCEFGYRNFFRQRLLYNRSPFKGTITVQA